MRPSGIRGNQPYLYKWELESFNYGVLDANEAINAIICIFQELEGDVGWSRRNDRKRKDYEDK